MSQNLVPIFELHFEHRVRERFFHGSLELDDIFFSQKFASNILNITQRTYTLTKFQLIFDEKLNFCAQNQETGSAGLKFLHVRSVIQDHATLDRS